MRRFISIIMTIILSVYLCSCTGSKETKSINVYFKDKSDAVLTVEETKYSGSQNTVDMANFALTCMIEGPKSDKYTKALPENCTVLSLSVKDETANVDFSENFTSLFGVDELLARFSVVRTLCDIPGISMVSITVNAMPLISNSTGNEVGVLSKKDVVLDVNIVNSEVQTTGISLYFATSDAAALKAETRNVKTQNSISIEKTIVSELIKGPSSPELSSVMPSGVKILNIETKDGICYVNLSQDFISKFAGGTGMLSVYSIVNSLCGIESVQGVQILIEGEKGAEFGNFVFDEPIVPNYEIVIK